MQVIRTCLSLCLALTLGTMAILALPACQTGGTGTNMSEEGSQPINEKEAIEYKQTLIRCQKSGGSRVVKIEGNLRCF